MLNVDKSSAGFSPIDEVNAAKFEVKSLPAARRGERQGGNQHVISLQFDGTQFSFDTKDMQVNEGDALVFHQSERQQPGFSVRGRVGDNEFSSTSLKDQAVFTHAFGLPGVYRWADANGSGIGGVITVKNEPGEGKLGAERSMKRMGEGVLVHIVGKKVEPQELTISTGQTVFFAVEKTDGITITDASLLKSDLRQ